MLASSYPALAVLTLYVLAMLAHAVTPAIRAYRARPIRVPTSSAGYLATRVHVLARKARVARRMGAA